MIICNILLDARSAGADLPRHLAALAPFRQQRSLHVQVLVADDTKDSRLHRLASKHDARIVTTEGTPLGDRLNVAVANSQGEALLFPAGGASLPAGWLMNSLADIEQHVFDAAVLTSANTKRMLHFWQRLHNQTTADTLCVSRAWFERIGGCDPSLDKDALADLIDRLRACQAKVDNGNS